MRLIEKTPQGFVLTKDLISPADHPSYAVLSHTWGREVDEVTMQDIIDGTGKEKRGYDKILFCAEQAEQDGLQHFWIDSCCIDQTNISELTTAINSMFRWYQQANRCYVYLSDVSCRTQNNMLAHVEWKSAFRNSRWFTRGWTLQELLAPRVVIFYSRDRSRLGDKYTLKEELASITGIDQTSLTGRDLNLVDVEEKFRWTKGRQTLREEDLAYCLLGIFDVSMPLIYGEGRSNAVRRLRREIRELTAMEQSTTESGPSMKERDRSLSTGAAAEREESLKPSRFESTRAAETAQQMDFYDNFFRKQNASARYKCIAVVGPSNAGKSSFIRSLLPSSNYEEEIVIREVSGYQLKFKIYPIVHRGCQVKLIDTPRFRYAYYLSDQDYVSFESLIETVVSIADQPSLISREWISRYHGFVHLLPITFTKPEWLHDQPPITPANCPQPGAVLATTSWNLINSSQERIIRERALTKPGGWWEGMYEAGSPILRHNETRESAMNILDWLLEG